MRIVMMTNTYFPHVGGVARSVESFSRALRDNGNAVMVVAPEFPEMPDQETDVVRVPAIQRFNGSDFSVRLPLPGLLTEPLERFHPDIIHAHHPFLLGDTALREASARGIPLIFTHHTLYEEYTHYMSTGPEKDKGKGSDALRLFAIDLSTGYANLCDHVIAPSQSIADLLRHRGVTTPISVVPTGVVLERFANPSGGRFRRAHGVPAEAFVVGHTGRLAPEKNLMFLTRTVTEFLRARPEAWFVVAGVGPLEAEMRSFLEDADVMDRVRFAGILQGDDLIDGYAAMDVFAFASQSETQGMVLVEAMAAGVPVVAVDASGVREVVENGVNGRKLATEDGQAFASALAWVADLPPEMRAKLSRAARKTATRMSMSASVEKLSAVYGSVVKQKAAWEVPEENLWSSALRRLQAEWKILGSIAHAAGTALVGSETLSESGVESGSQADAGSGALESGPA
jgi:1,2-diacylglycerol 3-alpha-glucosyltransferase